MWQEPAAARTARESVFRGLRGRVQAVGALTAVRAGRWSAERCDVTVTQTHTSQTTKKAYIIGTKLT